MRKKLLLGIYVLIIIGLVGYVNATVSCIGYEYDSISCNAYGGDCSLVTNPSCWINDYSCGSSCASNRCPACPDPSYTKIACEGAGQCVIGFPASTRYVVSPICVKDTTVSCVGTCTSNRYYRAPYCTGDKAYPCGVSSSSTDCGTTTRYYRCVGLIREYVEDQKGCNPSTGCTSNIVVLSSQTCECSCAASGCTNKKTYYQDSDGDGYGNPAVSLKACSQPAGYVLDNTDCDDTPVTGVPIHPGATEVCDHIDGDCDGTVDDGLTCNCYEGETRSCALQAGVCAGSIQQCDANTGQWVDCDYTSIPDYSPTEVCDDAKDNNCDGNVNEGCYGWQGFQSCAGSQGNYVYWDSYGNTADISDARFDLGGQGYPHLLVCANNYQYNMPKAGYVFPWPLNSENLPVDPSLNPCNANPPPSAGCCYMPRSGQGCNWLTCDCGSELPNDWNVNFNSGKCWKFKTYIRTSYQGLDWPVGETLYLTRDNLDNPTLHQTSRTVSGNIFNLRIETTNNYVTKIHSEVADGSPDAGGVLFDTYCMRCADDRWLSNGQIVGESTPGGCCSDSATFDNPGTGNSCCYDGEVYAPDSTNALGQICLDGVWTTCECTGTSCRDTTNYPGVGCNGCDWYYDPSCAEGWVPDNTDCDDGDYNVNPGVPEICDNGKDDDCDGLIDGYDPDCIICECTGTSCRDTTNYPGVGCDGCNWKEDQSCVDGWVPDNTDCDDGDYNVNPGVPEVCDNGKDDDCDGLIDGNDPDCIACTIKVACAADENDLFHIAALDGGHAQLNDQTPEYPWKVCCKGIYSSVGSGVGSSFNEILHFYGATDSHVEKRSESDFNVKLFLNVDYGTIFCNYPTGTCDGICIAGLSSGDTDLHVGDCNFNQKICCYYDQLSCTDNDGDAYYVEGGLCGAVDCDDNNPNVNPGATEICNNIDDDCDGAIDNGLVCNCYEGETRLCENQLGVCAGSVQQCNERTGQWVECDYGLDYEVEEERCDGLDNDCDSLVDEACLGCSLRLSCNPDEDELLHLSHRKDAHAELKEQTNFPWKVCCHGLNSTTDSLIGQSHVLGFSAITDAHLEKSYSNRFLHRLYFNAWDGTLTCGYGSDCSSSNVCVMSLSAGDYDLHGASCEPSETYTIKICCNRTASAIESCVDNDGDGYGINADRRLCTFPELDCDDAVYACNTDCWSLKYIDADGDSYGNKTVQHRDCDAPANYVADNTDCDDGNSSIHPGAPEICDGIDNNCDGIIDGNQQGCYTGRRGTAGIGVCEEGVTTCTAGEWGNCVGEVTGLENETCWNGLDPAHDEDCDGDNDDSDICIPKDGNITGTVTDRSSDEPIGGAKVVLKRAGYNSNETTTDSNGRYLFENVGGMTFTEISAYATDYKVERKKETFTVKVGDEEVINFKLRTGTYPDCDGCAINVGVNDGKCSEDCMYAPGCNYLTYDPLCDGLFEGQVVSQENGYEVRCCDNYPQVELSTALDIKTNLTNLVRTEALVNIAGRPYKMVVLTYAR